MRPFESTPDEVLSTMMEFAINMHHYVEDQPRKDRAAQDIGELVLEQLRRLDGETTQGR